MINLKQISLTVIITLSFYGCATQPPMQYNPADSRALNIAKAAGIGSQLKDTEVPADTLQKFTDSAAFGVGLTAAGYMSPLSGFSGLGMGSFADRHGERSEGG